jgi:hypothetical protein
VTLAEVKVDDHFDHCCLSLSVGTGEGTQRLQSEGTGITLDLPIGHVGSLLLYFPTARAGEEPDEVFPQLLVRDVARFKAIDRGGKRHRDHLDVWILVEAVGTRLRGL